MNDPLRFKKRYRVPSTRLRGWDYRLPGTYFVTICTEGRDSCLGEITAEEVSLSSYGKIVAQEWQRIPVRHSRAKLDVWIVMPDHVHGLLVLESTAPGTPEPSLGLIVGEFKSKATKSIRMAGHRNFDWQERFHDHIVRSEEELQRIRTYILENPKRWRAKQQRSG